MIRVKLEVNSCFDKLHSCLVAYPCYFDITVPINEKQERNKGQIDRALAVKQYNDFINLLQEFNVKTYFLNLVSDCSYQVFTRDIGFVIGNILFISKMKKSVREKEVTVLREFLKKCEVDGEVYQLNNNAEGGDVFVLEDFVLVGISDRTKESAVEEIKDVLSKRGIKKEVIALHFDTSKLHLDCVFGVLNKKTAVISPFLDRDSVNVLKNIFENLIEIDTDTADILGTNFVVIDDKRVIVTNRKLEKVLKDYSFQPIYIDYSEFIKAGGSVRCSILPLMRVKL